MQFDFTRRTPQGQVQASGPRDQGTGIGAGSFQSLANMAYGVQDIAKQRVQEQAESDMSAFQAQRIKMEQDFRENSANITNAQEYRKAVDKYITDINKYAEGKRPDGTKVFRNGMGSSAYKEFSRDYSAKFKAQGSEHAFQLDRKRDKLNYRIAINGGVNNTSGDPQIDEAAIIDGYDKLERDGHLTRQERIIEQERDIKAMTINRLNNQQAKILMTTEEILDRVNKEQMIFDGTGVKPRQDTMENAAKTIKGAFETYKAEVITNKNLDETERKKLIDGAKSSLKFLESAKKMEYAAQKENLKVEQGNVRIAMQRAILNDPANAIEIKKQFAVNYPNMDENTLTQVVKDIQKADEGYRKAQGDFIKKNFQEFKDNTTRSNVLSMDINNAEDYRQAIDLTAKIGNTFLRSQTLKDVEDRAPGKNPKDPVLVDSMKAVSIGLKQALGLDLTRAQIEKLDEEVQFGGDHVTGIGVRPDWIPETSLELYVGGLSTPQRQMWATKIENEYLRLYNEEGKTVADEYAKNELKAINSTEAKYKIYDKKFQKSLIRQKR